MLDQKARDIQCQLSERGKYGTWKEIIYELIRNYEHCSHIGDLGLYQAEQLQTIKDLIRLQMRIDTFLMFYESKISCFLLSEVEKAICSDYNHNNPNKVSTYEDLFVGPIICNQIVRQVLKIPEDIKSMKQIKSISLINILKQLENYLIENNLWSYKVKGEEFETFLLSKLNASSMSLIGVKINNIGTMIGTIKNVQHCYSASFNKVKEKLSDDWTKSSEQEIKILMKNFNNNIKKPCNLFNKTSIELIDDFLDFFKSFFNNKHNSKNHKAYDNIASFLRSVKEENYFRDCFQLAVCIGTNDLDILLAQIERNENSDYYDILSHIFFILFKRKNSASKVKFLEDEYFKITNRKYSDSTGYQKVVLSNNMESKSVQLTEEKLIEFIKLKYPHYFTLNFDHLITMEQQLWSPNPNETFLKFLNRNKRIFEQHMLKIAPISDDNQDNEHLKIKREQLIQHIKQLQKNTSDFKIIENSICKYYKVKVFSDLGLKSSLNELIAENTNSISDVTYINSILRFQNSTPTDFKVETNRLHLINKLIECPLLENIAKYLIGTVNLDGIKTVNTRFKQTKNQIRK